MVLLLAVLVVALASVAGPAREYQSQRAQLSSLRADIASRQEEVSALSLDVARWNDPAYVKAQARSRLHLVMPGETGYVVVGPASPSPTPSSATSPGATPSRGTASPSAAARLGRVSGVRNPLASASPTSAATP